MLIDTHSHIYLEDFNDDIDDVIKRAFHNEIFKIVLPNIDSSSVRKMLKLADLYPHVCYPLIGLHPTSVQENYIEELDLIEFWLTKRKFFGIGETGIDLYWDKSRLAEQRDAFRRQVILARQYRLPIVIHTREAFEEAFAILKEEKDERLRGVFHCFSGDVEQAHRAIELGFMLGVNGVVTFKNSTLNDVLPEVPLENILLETDSPYLTPEPFRGKRNESSYLIYIARHLAELYHISVPEIAAITTSNAERLFNI
jgi:TatD DNase family protein